MQRVNPLLLLWLITLNGDLGNIVKLAMYDRTQIKNCQLHVLDRIVKELHNISLMPVKEILHHKITLKNSSKPKFSLKPKQFSIPIIFFSVDTNFRRFQCKVCLYK